MQTDRRKASLAIVLSQTVQRLHVPGKIPAQKPARRNGEKSRFSSALEGRAQEAKQILIAESRLVVLQASSIPVKNQDLRLGVRRRGSERWITPLYHTLHVESWPQTLAAITYCGASLGLYLIHI